jgi:competence protein ComEC
MIAVPMTAMWVMPAGLIALFLMPLHLEALALVPMGWGAEAILRVARTTAMLPDATFDVPHIPAAGLCLFSFGLTWLGLWQTKRRLAGVLLMLAGLASPLVDRPPDVLVSADGRLIAVRTRDGAFLQATQGAAKFTRDAWAQYWAIGSFQAMPSDGFPPPPSPESRPVSDEGTLNDPPDQADAKTFLIRCEDDACLLRPYPDRPGALLIRGSRHPKSCARASVIVSAEPARGLCAKPWPKLVDRFTVWRYGSAAIWLNRDGALIVTDRWDRGDRPWVAPLPQPRKATAPTLPPASVDRPEQPETESNVPATATTNGE